MLLTIFFIIKVSFGIPKDIRKNTSSKVDFLYGAYDWTKYHKLRDHYQFLYNLELTHPRPGVVQAGLSRDKTVGKIPNFLSGGKCRRDTKQAKVVTGEGLWIWQGKG